MQGAPSSFPSGLPHNGGGSNDGRNSGDGREDERPQPPEVICLISSSGSDCSGVINVFDTSKCSCEIIVIDDSDEEVTSSAATEHCEVADTAVTSQPQQQSQQQQQMQLQLEQPQKQQQDHVLPPTVLQPPQDAQTPGRCLGERGNASRRTPRSPEDTRLPSRGRFASAASPRPVQQANVSQRLWPQQEVVQASKQDAEAHAAQQDTPLSDRAWIGPLLQPVATTANYKRKYGVSVQLHLREEVRKQRSADLIHVSPAIQQSTEDAAQLAVSPVQPSTPSAGDAEAVNVAALSGSVHSASDAAAAGGRFQDTAAQSEGRGSSSPPADTRVRLFQMAQALGRSGGPMPLQTQNAVADESCHNLEQLPQRMMPQAPPLSPVRKQMHDRVGPALTDSTAHEQHRAAGATCSAEGLPTLEQRYHAASGGSCPELGQSTRWKRQTKPVWTPRGDAAAIAAAPVHRIDLAEEVVTMPPSEQAAEDEDISLSWARRECLLVEQNAYFKERPEFEYTAVQYPVRPADLEEYDPGSESAVIQDGLQYAVAVLPCEGHRKELVGDRVCALEPIPKNMHVAEYTGEELDEDEVNAREKLYEDPRHRCYMFDLDDQPKAGCAAIDARFEGNITRLLNHSCRPNLMVDILLDTHKQLRILFKTKSLIRSGEELTIDYRAPVKTAQKKQKKPRSSKGNFARAGVQTGTTKCLCTPNCPNYIF